MICFVTSGIHDVEMYPFGSDVCNLAQGCEQGISIRHCTVIAIQKLDHALRNDFV